MKYLSLTKNDKLFLLGKTNNEKTTIKSLNLILKDLFKQNGIKTLRKFQNANEIFNKIYPAIQHPYDILKNQVETNKDYKPKTKTDYIYFLKKVQNFTGTLNDTEKFSKFIQDNFTQSSAIKILNLLVNYYRINNNKALTDFYYQIRSDYYTKLKEHDKSDVFKGQKEEDYIGLLNTMNDDKYKLIFLLMIKYPSLRISDYHSLKIGNGVNYISSDFKKVIFNKIVKVQIEKPIVILLKEEDQYLFKKVIGNETGDNLFDVSIGAYKKKMERLSKSVFNLIPHNFRRLSYLKLKDQINDFKNISEKQGHSMKTANNFYI